MEQIWVWCWVHFGLILGFVLGSVLGLEWAKMRQDDSNEDIKSLKVPKSIIFKSVILRRENHTFRVLEALKRSMRGSGRFPRGTWRASRPQKKGFQKWNQNKIVFQPILEPKWTPKWNPKWTKNLTRNGTKTNEKCCLCAGEWKMQIL